MRLLTVRGIPIRLHWSFLLLAGLYILHAWTTEGAGGAIAAAFLGTVLFGSVTLHELGHALTARAFGIPTRHITLYPFGGVASLEAEIHNPLHELLVALAGPGVNFLLAAVFALPALLGSDAALVVVLVNLVLGTFNLVPAYPMDGGRVLRAWLARRMDLIDATLRALVLSRLLAWTMLGLGLWKGGTLWMIGLVLLFITSAERRRWLAMRARREELALLHAWSADPELDIELLGARRPPPPPWDHPPR